jgi:hypothetical protein
MIGARAAKRLAAHKGALNLVLATMIVLVALAMLARQLSRRTAGRGAPKTGAGPAFAR